VLVPFGRFDSILDLIDISRWNHCNFHRHVLHERKEAKRQPTPKSSTGCSEDFPSPTGCSSPGLFLICV
jgi:hypothetical protein